MRIKILDKPRWKSLLIDVDIQIYFKISCLKTASTYVRFFGLLARTLTEWASNFYFVA